jgi:hypothetical protein
MLGALRVQPGCLFSRLGLGIGVTIVDEVGPSLIVIDLAWLYGHESFDIDHILPDLGNAHVRPGIERGIHLHGVVRLGDDLEVKLETPEQATVLLELIEVIDGCWLHHPQLTNYAAHWMITILRQ